MENQTSASGDARALASNIRMPAMNRERFSNLPERIEDRVLGTLRFSASLDAQDEYQATITIDGLPVKFDLYTDPKGSLSPCIKRARQIVERFESIKRKMHRYIERVVCTGYNEHLTSDEFPLTIDSVLAELELKFVTTHPTPNATFWFEAGDLFDGHSLLLFMAERNTFVGHDTPG